MSEDETLMDSLHADWQKAAAEADAVYAALDEDFTHPRFISAEKLSRECLFNYLRQPTRSLRHIGIKLEAACHAEDFFTDAENAECQCVAPRAVVAALRDLQRLK